MKTAVFLLMAGAAAAESDPNKDTAVMDARIKAWRVMQEYAEARAELAESMTSAQRALQEKMAKLQQAGAVAVDGVRRACKAVDPKLDVDDKGECK